MVKKIEKLAAGLFRVTSSQDFEVDQICSECPLYDIVLPMMNIWLTLSQRLPTVR